MNSITSRNLTRLVLTTAALCMASRAHALGNPPPQAGQPLSCESAVQKIVADREAHPELYTNTGDAQHPGDFQLAIERQLQPSTTPACGAEYAHAGQLKDAAKTLYAPARKNAFSALQNYSAQQQQTSTNSSTASVTPVSKVTGLSGIAEEFSGVSLSSGTSALTFQFAPGTFLDHFEANNVIVPCSPVLYIKTHCVSGFWHRFVERLTLSATTNTSSASQSITGKAAAGSSGTAASATLSNTGTTEPSFGGFGAKVVALYATEGSKNDTSTAAQKLDGTLSSTSALFANDLLLSPSCTLKTTIRATAQEIISQSDTKAVSNVLQNHYPALGAAFYACLTGSGGKALETEVQNYLAAYLVEVSTNEDVNAAESPLLGFEYDLNTPPNQPSYSSVKVNFSWSLTASPASKTAKKAAAGKALTPSCGKASTKSTPQSSACAAAQTAISNQAGGSKMASASPDKTTDAKASAASNAKRLTINASAASDLYNAEPSASIPSARHLRDVSAALEIDYIVPTSKIGKGIGNLMGDSTLAASYYYQDQTSPSILKGPPTSITFTGLPSTATQVYTTRGPINLGQIRYGFGTGSNISFPIAFTYSNRSELIAKPIKGLQFGLSYNLTSLFSGSK